MELLQTDNFYIFNKNNNSVWFDRKHGTYECKTCWDLAAARNPICLGIIHFIMGKVQILPDLPPHLILVTGAKKLGKLYSNVGCISNVYCITQVVFLPLTSNFDFQGNLELCSKHNFPNSNATKTSKSILPFGDFQPKAGLSRTFGTIKNVTSSIKTATVNVATGQSKFRKENREREKLEKRVMEELNKMFNESHSFYFSYEVDLTSSIQRQSSPTYDPSISLYRKADDRFFWNKSMLEQLNDGKEEIMEDWLIPVIQGHVQIESIPIDLEINNLINLRQKSSSKKPCTSYSLALISRRHRKRAGTRYKRRGIDEEANVANYVETEQIVNFAHHHCSFVQIRGSVPLFWSQPGLKYRPPPRLDKEPSESAPVFQKHFDKELSIYESVVCVSLVEQTGREKVIADAYLNHILELSYPSITYVSFDFHEYCRGMRYENVSVLIEGIEDVVDDMGYSWVDREGQICRQNGVFRINCIDCLDRTNVVQTAFGKQVMENQFVKLGIITPEQSLPPHCRAALQIMWANNGDALSMQYAGTSALKGDFTRTGERNFAGLMKDGMNSANRYYRSHFKDTYRQAALEILLEKKLSEETFSQLSSLECLFNVVEKASVGPPQYMSDAALGPEKLLAYAAFDFSRYYLNRFRDAYRQAGIDVSLGVPISEDLLSLSRDEVEGPTDAEDTSLVIQVKQVIEDSKKLLVHDDQAILGAWGLIDANPSTGDPEQTDMDVILILTKDSYYMAEYDEDTDRVTNFERVSLIDLNKIEFGPYTFQGMFKQSRTHYCLRLNYELDGKKGFYHMFRSMNMRFFNNIVVHIRTEEEIIESIKAIADTFSMACDSMGLDYVLYNGHLEKKKCSKKDLVSNNPFYLFSPIATLTKTSPDAFKSAGTRAISNVTSGLAKLNPMSNLKFKRHSIAQTSKKANFFVPKPEISVDKSIADGDQMISVINDHIHLSCCGIVATCHDNSNSITKNLLSLPVSRSFSCSSVNTENSNTVHFPTGERTPEILVSAVGEDSETAAQLRERLSCTLSSETGRVRLMSHSSDNLSNSKADLMPESGVNRAGSFNDLKPDLNHSTNSFTNLFKDPAMTFRNNPFIQSPLSPLSPLANISKDTVFAPFNVLARGVQNLAPGAGKLAKGVQNIGANILDPRKLRFQRQKQLEDDIELQKRKSKCASRIIQF